jgi:hypothetical protein
MGKRHRQNLPSKGFALVVTGLSGRRTCRWVHRIGAEHVFEVTAQR